jgi:MFS superfamily sulfate permease-like transporter
MEHDREGIACKLLRNWRSTFVVGVTFGLAIAIDLTAGVLAGCLVSILFDLERNMSAGNAIELS